MSVPVYVYMYTSGNFWGSNQPTPPTATQEAGTLVGVIKMNSDLKLQKIFAATGTAGSNLTSSNGVKTGITTQIELT
jgi:hypothetical protein